jgi:acid phosphatase
MLVVAALLAVLAACGGASDVAPPAALPAAGASSTRAGQPAGSQRVTKLLTVVEENHSLAQMRSGMPYLYGLAKRYGYADHYTAITHPSLPNYLAIAGGDTFGVQDDRPPSAHALQGQSVFGQALAAGRTAHTYEESMPSPCALSGAGDRGYAVRHNPWAYFVDERPACRTGDVSSGFLAAARADALPNAGMLMPNTCNDAHDSELGCDLGVADDWLRQKLPTVLGSQDFTSGALAVVLTADEDDKHSGNTVLTVVLHASLDGSATVVQTPLTHYSLSRLYSQVNGAPPLREAAAAPDLAAAFRLPVG